MRNLFTSLKALGIGAAFALLAYGHAAEAANPLELNFGLAFDHQLAIPGERKHLLEFLADHHRLRPDP